MPRQWGGRSAYEVMGVPEDCSPARVRKCFLEEARRWHPDKRHNDTPEELAFARARFIELHEAYEELEKKRVAPKSQASSSTSSDDWHRQRLEEVEEELQKAEKAYAEEKAAREEIEEYLAELRETTKNAASYTEEELQVLRQWHHNSFQALLVKRNEEYQYQASVARLRQWQAVLQEREESAPPQSCAPCEELNAGFGLGAAISYVGDSVCQTLADAKIGWDELAEDVESIYASISGFFTAWRVVREERTS
ncbi:unnamed protein product [Effrenium voratum]|nr:unnamed protein product [Effrenium voratum]